MRKIAIFLVGALWAAAVNGQEQNRSRTPQLIDWRPTVKTQQRYTIAISPLRLVSSGLKFDFEREMKKPGQWLGTSLTVWLAPERYDSGGYWDAGDNNRWSYYSAGEDFHRMWGLGTSFFYKEHMGTRGWYWSGGLVIDFFRVGLMRNSFVAYKEDGLTFYDYGRKLENKSYFKPQLQINIGRHMPISERCYFDVYAGLGLAYSMYADNKRHRETEGYPYPLYNGVNGFAYRGVYPVAGLRFGVLLWDARR